MRLCCLYWRCLHWSHLPLKLSSTEKVFHWGCLPLRSSSSEVVFFEFIFQWIQYICLARIFPRKCSVTLSKFWCFFNVLGLLFISYVNTGAALYITIILKESFQSIKTRKLSLFLVHLEHAFCKKKNIYIINKLLLLLV